MLGALGRSSQCWGSFLGYSLCFEVAGPPRDILGARYRVARGIGGIVAHGHRLVAADGIDRACCENN